MTVHSIEPGEVGCGDSARARRHLLANPAGTPEQIRMCPRPHEHDRAAFAAVVRDFVDQQEVAADVAFAGARPFALEGMIEPLGAERDYGDSVLNRPTLPRLRSAYSLDCARDDRVREEGASTQARFAVAPARTPC